MDMLEQGINPSAHKQTTKLKLAAEKTMQEVALVWHSKYYQTGNARNNKLVLSRLERYIFPIIGKIPLKDIEAQCSLILSKPFKNQDMLKRGNVLIQVAQ